jgi:hypothetical protein
MDFQKAIKNIQVHLPNDTEILDIIDLCDLYLSGDSWNNWSDFSQNILSINNKKISIYKNNKTINTTNDLHFKSHIKIVAQKSSWAMVSFSNETCFIWLLNHNNKLRFYYLENDVWKYDLLPLTSGIQTLRTLVKTLRETSENIVVDSDKIRVPFTTDIKKTWAFLWPPNETVKNEMSLQNNMLANKFLKECGVI